MDGCFTFQRGKSGDSLAPGPLLSHTLGLISNYSSHRVVVAERIKVFLKVLVAVQTHSMPKFQRGKSVRQSGARATALTHTGTYLK